VFATGKFDKKAFDKAHADAAQAISVTGRPVMIRVRHLSELTVVRELTETVCDGLPGCGHHSSQRIRYGACCDSRLRSPV